MNNDIRWKQRFQNFEKAFYVFQRRVDEYKQDPQREAFQMPLIRMIRQAFQSEIIRNGEDWMEAFNQRNLTTQVYDEATADRVLTFIDERRGAGKKCLNCDLCDDVMGCDVITGANQSNPTITQIIVQTLCHDRQQV